MSRRTTRYLHFIPGLRIGGAESHLARLLADWPEPHVYHELVSLLPDVPLAPQFEAAGTPVTALDFSRLSGLVSAMRALRSRVRAVNPDLLIGWMYHGNLAAQVARALAQRRAPVVWNIRATADAPLGGRSDWARRLGSWLSRAPASITYNAVTARARHAALGFSDLRATVIPNGVDVDRFRPSPEARSTLRQRLALPPEAAIVGRVARYHPMKGFGDAVRAVAHVRAGAPQARFVFAGTGVDNANAELVAMIRAAGCDGQVQLLGEVPDVAQLVAGFDVAISTSVSTEGFPNVVAEAMACGVPCVVTDVGDSARVVGETGLVVRPGDAAALARAVLDLLAAPAEVRRLGAAARERIVAEFGLAAARAQFARLWREAALAP